jgi:allantoinase
MAHAETPGPIARAEAGGRGPAAAYRSWLDARPEAAELEAVTLLCRLAEEYRARVHVVHVSGAASVALLRMARRRGVPVSAESCPHYLTFAADEIPDGATEFKCAPPIRTAEHRESLWAGLVDGTLDLVVSDHSPAPPALKRRDEGDFFAAWGGIASLQLGLSAVWTGARARRIGLERVAEWMCAGPARLVGLAGRKGSIAPGHDADLVVWRPEEEFVVEAGALRHRHPLTPYLGRRLAGVVEATYLGGRLAYRRGAPDPAPAGLLLQRTSA